MTAYFWMASPGDVGSLTDMRWRFKEICLPPSSPSPISPSDASKASRRSSPPSVAESSLRGSIFHRRIVASWEPDARMRGSPSARGGWNARHFTQSSCPGKDAAGRNYDRHNISASPSFYRREHAYRIFRAGIDFDFCKSSTDSEHENWTRLSNRLVHGTEIQTNRSIAEDVSSGLRAGTSSSALSSASRVFYLVICSANGGCDKYTISMPVPSLGSATQTFKVESDEPVMR